MFYYILALAIFLGWFTFIYGGWKFGIFKKYNISIALGFILMWRTKRGRKLIDRLSKPRTFWRLYGNLAIVICILSLVLMFYILVLGAYTVMTIRVPYIPLHHMLVIPGLNPIIPIWYGIFALVIAIIIHEFSHGILARRVKIKIKSLGVLMCIIPIGAFVEPDEKAMEKVSRADRSRIFASGLTTNIIFGLIFAGIFCWGFMGSLEPVEDGVIVMSADEGYPAADAGIKPGMMLTGAEGINANGTIIEPVKFGSSSQFSAFMQKRSVDDKINITIYENGKKMYINNVTLDDLYNYAKDNEYSDLEQYRGKGFLGVNTRGAGDFVNNLTHPILNAGWDTVGRRRNIAQFFFMPMDLKSGILPFHKPFTNNFQVTGPLATLPTAAFWILANMFFYLFWINILLGIFNAIPAVPLDGGYIFKDGMLAILQKIRPKMNEEKRQAIINNLTLSLALFVLLLFMMILFLGPYKLF